MLFMIMESVSWLRGLHACIDQQITEKFTEKFTEQITEQITEPCEKDQLAGSFEVCVRSVQVFVKLSWAR